MYWINIYLFCTIVLMSAFFSTIKTASHFILMPKNQSIIEGESVELKCQTSLVEGLEYSWMFNGMPIIQNERIFQIGSNLKILTTNRTLDDGNFSCIATSLNSGAREETPPAYLNILWISSPIVKLKIMDKQQHSDDILLKCFVEGSGTIKVDWFRNENLLKKSLHFDIQNKKLQINRATVLDNGVYRCVARNNANQVMTSINDYVLKLKNHNYPEIEIVPENKNVQIGESTSLHCQYKNSDKTEWIHDNNLLNKSKSIKIDQNGTLILTNLRPQNQGIYLCRGKRGDKVQEFSSVLSVMNSIRIIKPPENTKVYENQHVVLSCDFTHKKRKDENFFVTATVRWRKDGKLFREAEVSAKQSITTTDSNFDSNSDSFLRDEPRVFIDIRNGSLIFITTTVSDKGLYDCQILNNGNEIVTSNKAELGIIETLKFSPQPTSKNLELGSVSKVHCKAHGTPTPNIRWIQETNGEFPETIEDVNGTLFFRNVSANHKGNYTCIASNSQGTINATVTITIVVAPRFSVFPESQIQAIEMGTTMIHCQAMGDPKPTIQWDKDLEYLSNNNSSDENRLQILENGTLFITEVHPEDEGKYGCTIGNSGGLKREEVRLIIKPADSVTNEESTALFMIIRAILITMSVAFAYIVFVIVLMVWCRYKRQARKERLNLLAKENGDTGGGDGENKDGEIEPCLPEKKSKQISSNDPQKSGDDSVTSKVSKKSTNFDDILILRSNLTQVHQLGRGEFGDVMIMKHKRPESLIDGIKLTEINEKLNDLNEIKSEEVFDLVLVKVLKKLKEENVCMEFRRQLDMFRIVSHKNVTKLLGLCRDDGPHSMVLEWTDWGDLKQFLIATAKGQLETSVIPSAGSKPPKLKIAQILAVAHQIANGMDAIYRAKYIHKDLAARNCIISSNFTVKVSYPSLSKDKYSREYFKYRNQLLPIRWMPPETLTDDDDFSTKSDVFSYGVLIWEIFTQAIKLPFEEKTNEEYISSAQNGTLEWTVSESTPDDLKLILSSCWHKNPKERPSFSQLITALTNCLQSEYPKEQDES